MKASKSHPRLSPRPSRRSVSLQIRESQVTAKIRTPIPMTSKQFPKILYR
jgi:hypothetical protein